MEALFTIMHRNYVIYICNIPSRHPIHRHIEVYQGESDTGVGGGGGGQFFFLGSRLTLYVQCTQGEGWSGWGGGGRAG